LTSLGEGSLDVVMRIIGSLYSAVAYSSSMWLRGTKKIEKGKRKNYVEKRIVKKTLFPLGLSVV